MKKTLFFTMILIPEMGMANTCQWVARSADGISSARSGVENRITLKKCLSKLSTYLEGYSVAMVKFTDQNGESLVFRINTASTEDFDSFYRGRSEAGQRR